MAQVSGSQTLLDELTAHQVEVVFGYPGGAVIPLYDEVYCQKYNNILVRHEQGAAHAAEGYAKSTGKTGVVFTTSGPGATNALTGIADAKADSVPMVIFTGQVNRAAIGTNAFQEVDIVSMAKPITKAIFRVSTPSALASTIRQAFAIAQAGRKGPVLVDLPKDITTAMVHPAAQAAPATHHPTNSGQAGFTEVWQALKQARRPLFLFGNGAATEQASQLARQLILRTKIPAVATLLGLGIVPSDHPLFLGMGGMHGSYAANMALSNCDFLINIGARFDDRLATDPTSFAPHAKIAHFDIDPRELGKLVSTDYPVVADARDALEWLVAASQRENVLPHSEWNTQVKAWQTLHPFTYHYEENTIKPQAVIENVSKLTAGQAVVVTDVGQHQMWAAQFYSYQHPKQLVTSGGLGTMGFGLPAAIGAKVGQPEKAVVLFTGDGGFQMTLEELDVIRERQLNIKIVLFNNHALGMVKQWQDLFFNRHRSQTVFKTQPDFQQILRGYGIDSYRLRSDNWQEELVEAFASPHAAFIEVPIPADENVYPMVPAGKANSEMILE
ncbi:biosynthetic-type acetolactate synthase large subunit [Limosilactobacillus oris]|uniref:biosynthetic-type acetolactate synthase large subunit n=1 Tax=Limosilactobacillus oris TaxID=1632 RepID=UPI0024BBAFA2|nr:biosynthetic-type acetolactate synthase large subunit [Limosilactobacillus oris]